MFFSQVFFGKINTTGRIRELFARDFPIVYKAINDLKRKDYRQLAYLLQAHESKIMIDIICRKILVELPGTFIATIHDSIMTIPDRADEVKAIMSESSRDSDSTQRSGWKHIDLLVLLPLEWVENRL